MPRLVRSSDSERIQGYSASQTAMERQPTELMNGVFD